MTKFSALVVIATQNRHKVREIRKILGRPSFAVRGLDDFGLAYKVRETGKTLAANALLKARAAAGRTGRLCLADDTGLEVDALHGAPGVYSARFAGPACSYEDNNRKLLRVLDGEKRRTARFRCVVAVVLPDGRERLFEGVCAGRILRERRGSQGFGFDPLFQPAGHKKSFAEMSLRQKNRISHRSRAFLKARKFLQGLYRRSPSLFAVSSEK
ncbi:MAG TPA: RdgB/HAM1 family non-canonical purine NTP pyrophosphatase [Elusimicrobiota bacterium]|nr:RdgB/HAM1 family non-canonical purine NTP pyrophosphatase [Elusimicrobiota bacterium]